jgi:hypothetical protein
MNRLGLGLFVGWVVIALSGPASAQEATLLGTVTDTTGGALPGVTVTAVHEASGNTFTAVTDDRGGYRIAARVGTYRVTAELSGFAPATRTLTVLVGREAVANLQMGLSGVQETVTVSAEAPLLNTTESNLGGNLDPRQLEELPINGRNWVDLVLLAPGARGNTVTGDQPGTTTTGFRAGGDFALNVDGQAVTQQMTSASNNLQPRFSKDAIAEFEFVSSRFDATQGRSLGVQVNAVTKSGTNTPAGTLSGYFRDDRFNAADHVLEEVVEYRNQQYSATFGGPIRRDRVHFFAHYEDERQPTEAIFNTPYPAFNIDLSTNQTDKKAGGRLDAQFSSQHRLAVRGSWWKGNEVPSGSNSSSPSSADGFQRTTYQVLGTMTQVLSNRAVNEIKVGYADYDDVSVDFRGVPRASIFDTIGPEVILRGFSAGATGTTVEDQGQDDLSFRDDLTYSFNKRGSHTVKVGGEYIHRNTSDFRCLQCKGQLTANLGPVPANVESLFPDRTDASTWNLAPLSSITAFWRQQFGLGPSEVQRETTAVWFHDDWRVSPQLTMNLGVRYDLELNAFVNDEPILPMRPAGQPNDTNNVAPRLGFSYSATDRTVVRGGYGLFYGTVVSAPSTLAVNKGILIIVPNDGRPDFASNPWNGPEPTYDALLARLCTTALTPGCISRDFPTGTNTIYAPGYTMPYTHQSSIGLQRQIGASMAVEADYVYTGARGFPARGLMNLTYDPATGANYPFRDVSRRVYPEWGFVKMFFGGSRSNAHSLQTAFTRRFSAGWQASATYTLSVVRDAGQRPVSGVDEVPFETAGDLDGVYSLSVGDQRHRVVFNGIWQLPYGFQVSGMYSGGSGLRFQRNYRVDLRQIGTNASQSCECRLRPDGTIIPRNGFLGEPFHRTDVRVQRRFALGGRVALDGMVEVFNVFNRANFERYTTDEASRSFGLKSQNTSIGYSPRMMQLGFRLGF